MTHRSEPLAEPLTAESWLLELPLAALDFETTGLGPHRGDRVIEVAVVRGRAGETPTTWHTLIDPERSMAATQIHGITDAMVAGRPRFGEVANELFRQLDGAVLVAHNAAFDLSFLEMELARVGRTLPPLVVLDTLGLARRVLALGDHRLATLCARLGLTRDRAHRALDDARATWELVQRLALTADPSGHLRLGQAQLLSRRRTPEEHEGLLHRLEAARAQGVPLLIDYVSGDAPDQPPTRRTITIVKLTRSRVNAFCHLRAADRTFRVDRLRIVTEGSTPPRAG